MRRGMTIAVVVLLTGSARGQISPGELSAAHAGLEGVNHCTSCHAIGRSIENADCLACHGEIQVRMQRRTGLHGSFTARRCTECHKEHHGRDFDLIRFDTTRFDHRTAGFELKGKHARVPCVQCHQSSHVKDRAVRENLQRVKNGTYLGLGWECVDCHNDVHRGQFRTGCTDCHGMQGWKPLVGFDHTHTRFPLTGSHAQVECGKCHRATGPQQSVQFTGVPSASCSSCHSDPHAGKFKNPCESCHTTTGWSAGAASRFDHRTTNFPLKGKHATVLCAKCHGGAATGKERFRIREFQRCADCHRDPHRGRFVPAGSSVPCEQCHVETGWKTGPAGTFDHDKTRFALRGKHQTGACDGCHGPVRSGAESKSIARRQLSYACNDCHLDMHAGEFVVRGVQAACDRCHTEDSFVPAAFGFPDHARTRFPLMGAHRAVQCVDCHPTKRQNGVSVRQFRREALPECGQCHTDVHRGKFVTVSKQGCRDCHTAGAWAEIQYNHDLPTFKLSGRHRGIACYLCHGPGGRHDRLDRWKFAGTPTRCADCHASGVRGL